MMLYEQRYGVQWETKVWLNICKRDQYENSYVVVQCVGGEEEEETGMRGGGILTGCENDGISNIGWFMFGSFFLCALSISMPDCCHSTF